MRLSFFGAAGTVTGSCFGVGEEILVDFGMYQGVPESLGSNRDNLGFDPAALKSVLITHAHLDHCGRLPLLAKSGFLGKIFMTPATRDLVEIVLMDSAKIAEQNALEEGVEPLYSSLDVEETLRRIEVCEYSQKFMVDDGIEACFYDAGHILGSASVKIESEGKSIVFSGDLGNSPQDIVKPTVIPENSDFVVMESTYGDRVHTHDDVVKIIEDEVNTVDKSKGTLLIPAFSLERTQELLHIFDHLKKEGKIDASLPVYLDSPMAIRATEVFGKYRNLFNKETLEHSKSDDPFDFPGLIVTASSNDSRKIAGRMGGKVIIAGSGMMSGGRIMNHAAHYLPSDKTRLLIVGYQGVGTLGRDILEKYEQSSGRTFEVVIGRKTVAVNAVVNSIEGMSAHADQNQLMKWLSGIKGVKKVFLVHGEDGREPLAYRIKKELNLAVGLPVVGDVEEI
jgi:metallo-beta-lactamase family protein